MKKQKRFIKYFIAIFILAVLAVCIWGIPLKETTIFVKSDGTNVTGKFTGTWSPVTGKKEFLRQKKGGFLKESSTRMADYGKVNL
ncbi:MAG: hypothetical protein ACLUFH_13320 [Monoglobales bacterium]